MTDLSSRLQRAIAKGGAESSDYDLNPGIKLPAERILKPAAVLVAVTAQNEVILTKRSARLKHHPGQIAFPGGRKDDTDASVIDAALRESHEEIGLPRDAVQVVGTLPSHETVTAYDVTPVVGLITRDFDAVAELGEVAEIFHVPLEFVTNKAHFRIENRLWRGQRRRYYTVPFGPYYIWGATARILRSLADRMAE